MSRFQRVEYLKKMVEVQEKKNDKHTFNLRWRDENIYPVVIKVETSFLRYRLENGRTRRKQLEYLEKNPGIPKDLFGDPESNEAQEAQHKILLEMIDAEGLNEDIIREGQRDPAIITYDGYVLNGNRRLAVLRKEGTQYMDCVVLPEDADRQNLFQLELDLQMAKETKAPYNWVDELLHIRYGIENLEIRDVIVAKNMRISPQEVRSKLSMLKNVDLYLDWLGTSNQYYRVEDVEQVFIELEKYSKKLKDTEKQRFFRESVFGIIKNPPEEGRLYGHVTKLFNNLDEVVKIVGENINETPTITSEKIEDERKSPSQKNIFYYSNDPIVGLAQTNVISEPEPIPTKVTNLFSNPERAKNNVPNIINAIQDADAKSREKKDRKAAYNGVSEALKKLQGITIDSSTLEIDGINKKLQEINRKSIELQKIIENIKR